MHTIFDETQKERDEEIARYLGVPLEVVEKYEISKRFGPTVHDGKHFRARSYNFLYKKLGKKNPAKVLRTLSTFNVIKRGRLIHNAIPYIKGGLRKIRVLDFGCGPGGHGIYFLQHGAKVNFLDVNGPVYKFARWRVSHRKLEKRARFLVPESKLPTDFYDVVLCIDVLEHVANPLTVLKHLIKAARPNAFILLQIGYHINPKQGHFKQSIGRLRTGRCQKYIKRVLQPLEPAKLTKAEKRRCYYFRKL